MVHLHPLITRRERPINRPARRSTRVQTDGERYHLLRGDTSIANDVVRRRQPWLTVLFVRTLDQFAREGDSVGYWHETAATSTGRFVGAYDAAWWTAPTGAQLTVAVAARMAKYTSAPYGVGTREQAIDLAPRQWLLLAQEIGEFLGAQPVASPGDEQAFAPFSNDAPVDWAAEASRDNLFTGLQYWRDHVDYVRRLEDVEPRPERVWWTSGQRRRAQLSYWEGAPATGTVQDVERELGTGVRTSFPALATPVRYAACC